MDWIAVLNRALPVMAFSRAKSVTFPQECTIALTRDIGQTAKLQIGPSGLGTGNVME